jgi:hypothetical protein
MNRNLISFSLWGNNPLYIKGALENITLASTFYPGWLCRYYVNENVKIINELKQRGCEVIITHDKLDWRQAAASDENADYIIFRDVDSRLGHLEAKLVTEWMTTGEIAQIIYPNRFRVLSSMRKKPYLLGGLWGVKGGKLPKVAEQLKTWHSTHNHFVKNHDYKFADEFIMPIIGEDLRIDKSNDKLMGAKIYPKGVKKKQKISDSNFCKVRAHCSNCRNMASVRKVLIKDFIVENVQNNNFPCPEGFTPENLPIGALPAPITPITSVKSLAVKITKNHYIPIELGDDLFKAKADVDIINPEDTIQSNENLINWMSDTVDHFVFTSTKNPVVFKKDRHIFQYKDKWIALLLINITQIPCPFPTYEYVLNTKKIDENKPSGFILVLKNGTYKPSDFTLKNLASEEHIEDVKLISERSRIF